MAKEKNKPVPVRFDLKLLEVLKEEEKVDTPQQALNFLSQFWENNRPAKDELAEEGKEARPAPVTKVERSKNTGDAPESKPSKTAAHPSGLSGIDLSIWKAEQKEKNKNA